jgi:23S rRNA G2445 N2-methylase RlmL
VIDFESKRARFEKLQLSALRFPREKFTYIGHGDRIVKTDLGEVNSLSNLLQRMGVVVNLPYGCRVELAAMKKLERDPFNEGAPYSLRITILNVLWIHIATCSQRIYTGALPW